MTKILFAFSIILMLTTGFFQFICNPGKMAPQFKYVKKINIQSIDKDSIRLKVVAVIINNAKSSLKADKILLHILLGKDTIGYAVSSSALELVPDSNDIYLSVCLETNKIIRAISESKNDSLVFTLSGKIKAKIAFLSPEIEINTPFAIKLKENLLNPIVEGTKADSVITIGNIGIEELGLTSTKIIVDFAFTNPYNLEYELLSFPSTISIYSNEVGPGNLQNPPLIINGNKSKTFGKFLFNANNLKSLSVGLTTFLNGGKADYYIEGILHIKIFNSELLLPFSKKGKIDLREKL